jgi:G:T-mismatch repair DNA endonuclease (very short patch repair protein)
MFKCPRCNNEYSSYNSLSKHTRTIYRLSGEALYREYNGIKEIPLCKCGCGTPTKWRIDRGYAEYATGHNSKGVTNVMYGKTHTEKAKQSISAKRKEKFASGEYEIWQHKEGEEYAEARKRIGEKMKKENNPARAKKISDSLKGIVRTEEHQQKLTVAIKKAWENTELRERQRLHAFDRITEKGWQITSKLEDKFAMLLTELNIKHHRQHAVREIKSLYDFYLSEYNVIVEVHGDFWHCNPSIERYSTPQYAAQIANIESDKIKSDWCKQNNIKLLIFWESDILNNPQKVITELLAEINKTSP